MKNRLVSIKALAIIAIAMGLDACSNDNNDNPDSPTPPAQGWTAPEYTVSETRDYNKARFIDRAIGANAAMIGQGKLATIRNLLGYDRVDLYTYHEAVINYRSVDHKGNPIELSGVVSYKTQSAGAFEVNQIVVDNHGTICDNASSPSEGGSFGQLFLLKPATVVISGDYQGYGASRSALHPYLVEDLTARQQADLAKAAVKYLSGLSGKIKFSPTLATYLTGYSQGGAVALAMHRYLEQKESTFAKAVGFRGSVPGEGPYDLVATLTANMGQGYVAIPAILPMLVRSMIECYPEIFGALTVEDYFTPEFLAAGGGIINLLDQKELNILAYSKLLGAQNVLAAKFPITSILRPEVMQPGSPQLMAMIAAFQRNNCIAGWTPTHPVCFYHSKDDTVVAYDNLGATSEWPSGIYKIMSPSKPGVDHFEGMIYYYSETLLRGLDQMLM